MDSGTLQLGLSLIVLAWTIISAIAYTMRRYGNRDALRQLKRQGQPLRRLGAQERALVQPFLYSPAHPRKSARLVDDGVFPLRGAFVRHGLRTSSGAATLHDTLGGVDVVLPYDARDFLLADNHAEVVVTEKFVIVVALNGVFDLAGGRERQARRRVQDQQWSGGRPGAMQNVVDADDPSLAGIGQPADAQAKHEFEEAMRVEILGQRDETPAEIAYRRPPGFAFWPAALWLATFACLAAVMLGAGMTWLALAGVPALLALWLTWRRRSPGAPQKVNRARGELNAIMLSNPANSQAALSQLFLGDKLPIVLPDHWRADLKLPDDGRVDLDLRVQDYSVLRLGKCYSVDEEQRLFPRVYWGRHVLLALVGLLAGACLGAFALDVRGDIALASAWVRGAQPRVYDTAAALAAVLPAPGDVVALKGAARCQFQPGGDERPGSPRFDCERLRWDGDALDGGGLRLDPAVYQLYAGTFLKTRPNPMMDILVRSQASRALAGNPLAAYNARNVSALTVARVTDLVLTIEQACEAATGRAIAECDRLKAELVQGLQLARDEPDNWLALYRLAREGAFKRQGNSDEGVLIARTADHLRALARSSMLPAVLAALDQSALDLMARQRGGVALQVLPGRHATLPQLSKPDYGGQADVLRDWGRQVAMLGPNGAMPFTVAGLVTRVGSDEADAPFIVVDAARSLDDPWPSLARVLWLALATLLVAVHLPLAVLRLRAASARKRGLAEYARRPVATPSTFF